MGKQKRYIVGVYQMGNITRTGFIGYMTSLQESKRTFKADTTFTTVAKKFTTVDMAQAACDAVVRLSNAKYVAMIEEINV